MLRFGIELGTRFRRASCSSGESPSNLHRYAEALECYKRILKSPPRHLATRMQIGSTLFELGRHEEAIKTSEKVREERPRSGEVWKRIAFVKLQSGKLESAHRHYARRHAWREDPKVQVDLAIACLSTGRWEEGFRRFEWRWKLPTFPARTFPVPRWNGKEMPDGTLYVHAEQGLEGDTLQFARYLPLARERARKVDRGSSVAIAVVDRNLSWG